MLTLEHLIQHYMRFSDGLPINLRYPVQPKPKPPLPLFSTIPKHNRKNAVRIPSQQSLSTPLQSPDNSPQQVHNYPERKMSADNFHTSARTQRNLSIPSDDLMNQIGIFSTSPSNDQQPSTSPNNSSSPKKKYTKSSTDILNFRSLKLPKKNIIRDGMKSLKKVKSPKDGARTESAEVVPLQHIEEISQSLRNLTFSPDFKANEETYNVPTNNGVVAEDDGQKVSATDDGKTSTLGTANVVSEYFTKSDKTFLGDLPDACDNDKNNIVEEIYFVDAPSKTIPMPSTSFNYVAFKQVPYFPDGSAITTDQANNNSDLPMPTMARLHSTTSINSNESELIMALQSHPNNNANSNGCRPMRDKDGHQPTRPNYYIPKGCIVLSKVLGEGEFGSVYQGMMKCESETNSDVATDVPVAIKTLHDEHCKENRAEFLREASVMIKLSHHCIVKLLGISKVCLISLIRFITFEI